MDNDFYFPAPAELDFNQWVSLCRRDLNCEIETDIIVKAMEEDKDE